MEKLIWISKETYLPTKYQSSLSFDMTPIIIGGMDPNTGNMIRFNQSMRLGEISVNIETTDAYTGFDTPLQIAPPEEALKAESISPSQIQLASTA
jgi:sensor c-di-GMP phosphodiesterase-like protein